MDPLATMSETTGSSLSATEGSLFGIADVPVDFETSKNEEQLREALERQKRGFDLAMSASKMGTWRYTLADNICVYDENAQGLYGLTEGRLRLLTSELGGDVKLDYAPAGLKCRITAQL